MENFEFHLKPKMPCWLRIIFYVLPIFILSGIILCPRIFNQKFREDDPVWVDILLYVLLSGILSIDSFLRSRIFIYYIKFYNNTFYIKYDRFCEIKFIEVDIKDIKFEINPDPRTIFSKIQVFDIHVNNIRIRQYEVSGWNTAKMEEFIELYKSISTQPASN